MNTEIDGAIILKTFPHKYTLEELLALMTQENEHPEISVGPEVGAEIVEYNLEQEVCKETTLG
jgi:hypothetical protein